MWQLPPQLIKLHPRRWPPYLDSRILFRLLIIHRVVFHTHKLRIVVRTAVVDQLPVNFCVWRLGLVPLHLHNAVLMQRVQFDVPTLAILHVQLQNSTIRVIHDCEQPLGQIFVLHELPQGVSDAAIGLECSRIDVRMNPPVLNPIEAAIAAKVADKVILGMGEEFVGHFELVGVEVDRVTALIEAELVLNVAAPEKIQFWASLRVFQVDFRLTQC